MMMIITCVPNEKLVHLISSTNVFLLGKIIFKAGIQMTIKLIIFSRKDVFPILI